MAGDMTLTTVMLVDVKMADALAAELSCSVSLLATWAAAVAEETVMVTLIMTDAAWRLRSTSLAATRCDTGRGGPGRP